MDMIVREADAVAEAEAYAVALWQACGLTTTYNDPGADFRFAVAVRHRPI